MKITEVSSVDILTELSNELLGRYKQAAGAAASSADKQGDYKTGDKRFSGIVKATKKQFDNDAKKHVSENEIDEELIDESSLSRLVGKNPGSKKLIQWLHRKHKLGNEAEIVPAKMNSKRLMWKSFKSDPDQFIVVICQNGVAGIKPDEKFIRQRTAEFTKRGKEYNPGGDATLPYELVAFTDDGTELDPRLFQAKGDPGDEPVKGDPRVIKARMGLHTGRETQNPDNVFNLIAEKLGGIQSVYLTGEAPEGDPDKEQPSFKGGVERDKINTRQALKTPPKMSEQEAVSSILSKVRPVLKQLGTMDIASAMSLVAGAIETASGAKRGTEEFAEWANDAAKGNSVALRPVLSALKSSISA